MAEKIHLIWAEKFRDLVNSDKAPIDIIAEFETYCNEQEDQLNDDWVRHEKSIRNELKESAKKTKEFIKSLRER